MNLRRFTQIRGLAFKVVPLPRREFPAGKVAHVDVRQRVVFVSADVTDPGEQRKLLAECRTATERKRPGKGAA